ncbi:MAG TPA: methylated-DNA--[protein]-cysteine S-methyltransferase [Mycobacteriales bacterium]|nr:methylated-DNA--[protein]-cysteine S-methyltransferase [Mycobacteriales bacterium]
MTLDATTIATPTGSLSVIARDGVVVAAGFASVENMAARVDDGEPTMRRDLGPISRALTAYFEGDLAAMDDLAIEQPGGDFLQAAWKVMREVPAGETITYTELAERIGRPRAVRAAGSACARNRIAPIIPCHRILRADGTVGGYFYGLASKRWLLEHERSHLRG